MVGVEQWAEVRRMKRVEGLSAREISERTGLARDTVARLLAAEKPPKYSRAPAGSILDPFKDWICEQLKADASVTVAAVAGGRRRSSAMRVGKTIFDELRPRGPAAVCAPSARSSGRSIGRRSWSSAICGSRGSMFRSAGARRRRG